MDQIKKYKTKNLIYLSFFTVIFFSCGSYQYSGYINDGIYQSNETAEQYASAQEITSDNKQNNDYYKSAFGEKVIAYSDNESSDELFTDVENYISSENDSTSTYGPWGEKKTSIIINIHSHHNDGFWSRWRYPNWMWNYGYGYGNVWGYGYNNYWSRPYAYYGGMYNPFNPFWGYYNTYYGYGYGYANMWGYGYNSWYNNYPYSQNWNTPVSLISGRRGSRNAISSRSLSTNNSGISDRFNRTASSSLNDRLNRIDRINSAARINRSYYNKPFSNGSSNNLSKPSSNSKPGSNYSNSKPGSNYSNSKPSRNNNYSRPSNDYKPANSGYSPSNYSRPSYSPSSSSSSYSRGSSSSSSRGGSSRGGKIG